MHHATFRQLAAIAAPLETTMCHPICHFQKRVYITNMASLGIMARAIKPTVLGQPSFTITNVHGPFFCDPRDKLDTWLEHMRNMGVHYG